MRQSIIFAAGVLMVALGMRATAHAQWQGSMPPGDYAQTCQDMRMNGPILEARCQKSDGGWRSTSLDTRGCSGQVANIDGHLRCGESGYGYGGGWQGGIPSGDYQQTCQDIRANGPLLEARCQKRDGGWRTTTLDMRGCSGQVSNVDGNLRCGQSGYGGGYGGGWQGGVPSGDYQQTCQDIRANGSLLEARCQKRDGGWRTTSLDMRGCGGQVINDDGYLRCGEGGYNRPGWRGGAPGGDYAQTCQNIRTDGGRLEADCQTRDGDLRHTSLNDYDDCRSGIVNDDGHLRCRK